MRRLYLQVYLTIVGSLVLVVVTAGVVWHFIADVPPFDRPFELAGEVAAEFVPPAEAPREVQQRAIARLAARLGADVALFGPTGEQLAAVGRPLPFPARSRGFGGWLRGPGDRHFRYGCRTSVGSSPGFRRVIAPRRWR
jgi:hypothetical protein